VSTSVEVLADVDDDEEEEDEVWLLSSSSLVDDIDRELEEDADESNTDEDDDDEDDCEKDEAELHVDEFISSSWLLWCSLGTDWDRDRCAAEADLDEADEDEWQECGGSWWLLFRMYDRDMRLLEWFWVTGV